MSGYNIVVVCQISNLDAWIQFPLPALMINVKDLIKTLQSLPEDSKCLAVDDYTTGLVIFTYDNHEIGYISTTNDSKAELKYHRG